MQSKKIHINKYTKEIYFINLNSAKQRCAETKKKNLQSMLLEQKDFQAFMDWI